MANRLHGHIVPRFATVEGYARDTMLARLQAVAPDCRWRGHTVIVSDDLAGRAAPRAQMILGNDYVQRTRMGILLAEER